MLCRWVRVTSSGLKGLWGGDLSRKSVPTESSIVLGTWQQERTVTWAPCHCKHSWNNNPKIPSTYIISSSQWAILHSSWQMFEDTISLLLIQRQAGPWARPANVTLGMSNKLLQRWDWIPQVPDLHHSQNNTSSHKGRKYYATANTTNVLNKEAHTGNQKGGVVEEQESKLWYTPAKKVNGHHQMQQWAGLQHLGSTVKWNSGVGLLDLWNCSIHY